MASSDEYQQRRSFEDEYPKRWKIGDVEVITIKDGFGGWCTFVPHPLFNEAKPLNIEENLKTNNIYEKNN